MAAPLLLFQHIPKTAGTSLHYVVERQYRPLLVDWYAEPGEAEPLITESTRAVIGHFRFGLHERFPDRDCRYVTFMRHPLEQAFSHYHYLRKNPGATGEYLRNVRPEDFPDTPHGNNFQLRFISGMDQIEGREQEALLKASTNLDNHYDFCGLTEHFDESLILLSSGLKWKPIFYLRGAVNPSKPAFPQDLKRIWEKKLEPELELYSRVEQRFFRQAGKYKHLSREVSRLRSRNRLFTFFHPLLLLSKRLTGKI